jgi:hypothetical protein
MQVIILNNDEIRGKILDILYKQNQEHPGGLSNLLPRDFLKEKLGIEDNELNRNVLYLKDQGFLDIPIDAGHVTFLTASITSKGIDLVEHPERFNPTPAFVQHINISNSPGAVVNSQNVTVNIQDSFNNLYEKVNSSNSENKEEINSKVREIQEELENENINTSKVRKSIDYFKSNAKWIIPYITNIILVIYGLKI